MTQTVTKGKEGEGSEVVGNAGKLNFPGAGQRAERIKADNAGPCKTPR